MRDASTIVGAQRPPHGHATIEPNVILRGGSAEHLPDALCTRHVEDSGVPLKIQWGNRYEHFSPTVEKVIHDGNELLVFAWTTTTYVAE